MDSREAHVISQVLIERNNIFNKTVSELLSRPVSTQALDFLALQARHMAAEFEMLKRFMPKDGAQDAEQAPSNVTPLVSRSPRTSIQNQIARRQTGR